MSRSSRSTSSQRRRLSDVGGTAGGILDFVIGAGLLGGGAYLFLSRVVVMSGLSSLFGESRFGLVLLPIVVGVTLLFFDGGAKLGWLLAAGGLVTLIVGLIADFRVFFQPTGLFATVAMLVMMLSGLGMVVRALRPHGGASTSTES